MQGPFSAVKITEDVYWVGAIDWSLRDFHGYATDRGTTYNAYLILADDVTLVDTVKGPFREEMFGRIGSVIEPSKIRYIISNHSEMDHTGCLPEAVQVIKPEKVFASANGVKALAGHFHGAVAATAVANGEELSLGNKRVRFIETKMLHWPDSMFSYLVEDQILFSQDGFGMHLATTERFDEEIERGVLIEEAAKYYANILLPFAPMVSLALKKAGTLPLKLIAPDHGPVWRRDIDLIVDLYTHWAGQKPGRKAVIVYDTMWGSTAAMAKAIEDGLVAEGVSVKSMRLKDNHRSDVATEMLGAGALIVGSPTLNNQMFPSVADMLTYLKGLKPKNLVGAVFGSYGWSEAAVRQLADAMNELGIKLVADPLSVQYVPDRDALVKCRELGRTVAQSMPAS
ncbi:MAG: FprA family A-type flavoprotein [Candidatus Hydrogenedentes bacterium]|nr:FprA family A-type flavoprotein [Candidatus Hydrogenedentota bacterium]